MNTRMHSAGDLISTHYKCMECCRPIKIHDTYHKTSGKDAQGDPFVEQNCAACEIKIQALWNAGFPFCRSELLHYYNRLKGLERLGKDLREMEGNSFDAVQQTEVNAQLGH